MTLGDVQQSYEQESIMTTDPRHFGATSYSPSTYDEEDQQLDHAEALGESPELPPLPLSPVASTSSSDILSSIPLCPASPTRPTRAPPPPPVPRAVTTFRSSLKNVSPMSNEFPNVPPLPSSVTSSPDQPPFQAIVMLGNPSSAIDRSKIIVSLETETRTYKTTISTLTSRPSHLATFLMSLLPDIEESDELSVYSNSEEQSMYHRFLAKDGMLSSAPFTLHIFLDRPSASYAHVLSYLRSSAASPTMPDTLPRNVKLQTSTAGPSRFDALLDLRDEAAYLGLTALMKICNEELRQRLSVMSHPPIRSSPFTHSASSSRSLPLLSNAKHHEHGSSSGDKPGADSSHSGYDPEGVAEEEPRRVLRTPVSLHRQPNMNSTASSSSTAEQKLSSPRPCQVPQDRKSVV